jgi:glycosyltransferase involved in cell wall biosynthesis
MTTPQVAPERRLRICVVGDFDGTHTHEWVRYFVERGHEVHGVSYYEVARPPRGVRMHVLRSAAGGGSARTRPGVAARAGRTLPIDVQRLVNLLRYRRAGLARTVREIAPDVLHAHYLVEHAFYATSANFHPYVVSAWGSDVLVDAARSRLSRAIARFVLGRAELATANNRHMAREMVLKLGIERGRVQHIVLGVSRAFLDGAPPSVNLQPGGDGGLTVLSTRSLDKPLYNIDSILRAMAHVRERVPTARLIVAGEGRLRPELEGLARELKLGDGVRFTGSLPGDELRNAMARAHVFVSVPSSDGTSVALLQAMGAGCLPILPDIPSQQELVENGTQGIRVPVRDDVALASAIETALGDPELRRAAAERNREFVESYGVTETNMARMEAWYYRLAGRTADYERVESVGE